MPTSWRPANWNTDHPDPCEKCGNKNIDVYGWLCDIACGKRSDYVNFENGAEAMLNSKEVQEAMKEKYGKIWDSTDWKQLQSFDSGLEVCYYFNDKYVFVITLRRNEWI